MFEIILGLVFMIIEREIRENILFLLGFIFWFFLRLIFNYDNIVKILFCFWMKKKLCKIKCCKDLLFIVI